MGNHPVSPRHKLLDPSKTKTVFYSAIRSTNGRGEKAILM